MSTWKRLSRENKPVDVNLDAVIYMQEHEGYTALHFAAYGGDCTQSISVSETPDEFTNYLRCTRTSRLLRRGALVALLVLNIEQLIERDAGKRK
jgi:hypothetical protein